MRTVTRGYKSRERRRRTALRLAERQLAKYSAKVVQSLDMPAGAEHAQRQVQILRSKLNVQ